MKCFSDVVVHAKTKIGTFEKFADHADLADFPSALEHVSTWFLGPRSLILSLQLVTSFFYVLVGLGCRKQNLSSI